jgi:hypothetical protein
LFLLGLENAGCPFRSIIAGWNSFILQKTEQVVLIFSGTFLESDVLEMQMIDLTYLPIVQYNISYSGYP